MIGSAQQKGSTIYVYDESGRILCTKSGELVGFTSSTFTVRQSHTLYTYDEKGHIKFTKSI